VKNNECTNCGEEKRSEHFNTKYCEKCRAYFLRYPKSTLTKEQRQEAEKLIGKMDRKEIAEHLGVSLANLKRAFRGRRLAFHNKYARQPDLVKAVCKYYEKHGKIKTQKKFPQVCVRSVVERYPYFKPRQTRWSDSQIVEAAKMSGLISMNAQAKWFNRPNAFEGSIKSLWTKRFGFGGGSIHGLSYCVGKELVTRRCKPIDTFFWQTVRNEHKFGRKLYLWVDIEKHLKSGFPDCIDEAVTTMADFQRWIFQTDNPRRKILQLMKERELHA
jgi:hypothetical protein